MTDQPTGGAIVPAYAAAMPAPQGGALPTTLEWGALEKMAHTLADSDLVPYKLKRKPADVAVILLAAREYGIPPLMALSKLPVVNGTPAPMGELMVALILRAGHKITAKVKNPDGSLYRPGVDELVEGTYGECRTLRRDEEPDDEDVLTFSLKEAIDADLVQRLEGGRAIARVTKEKSGRSVEEPTPWELYTPNMLRWRAVANSARLRFPDVLLGLSYLPEELGAVVDAEGRPVIDVEPERSTGKPSSLAAREAQEAADRIPDVTDHRILTNVRAWADANGVADQLVDYAGSRLTLAEALDSRVEWLRANVVDVPATPAPSAPQSAPPATDTPAQPAEPASEPQSPGTAAPDAPPAAAAPVFPDAARELVLRTKVETDYATVRAEWAPAKAAGLLEVVIPPDDLPDQLVEEEVDLDAPVTVGAYLMAVGKRLNRGAGPLIPLAEPGSALGEPVVEDPPSLDNNPLDS